MSETAETTPPPSTSETPNDPEAASASASASLTPVVDQATTNGAPSAMAESTINPIQQVAEATTTTDNTTNETLSADAMAKAKKHKDRLEQNRISARESRKRKKTMIEELQKTVITMSRENKELNARNEMLRNQLMEIGTKYPSVVPIQSILSGIGAPPTMANTPTTPHIIHHNHSTPDASTPKEPSWQEEATV